MQIFVTGGAGFIGSHLVKLLVQQGHTVHVFDDLSSGRRERISGYGEAVQFTRGDVCDAEAVAAAMHRADLVFHLAAMVSVVESVEHPPQAYATNVLGTVHVLEAARRHGVQRVVQASTCAVYGNTEQLPVSEQTPVQPLSPYASTKLAAEQAGQLYHHLYGLATVALRFFNVYGPGQDPASPYAAVVPRFVAALRAGEQPRIFGDGLQSRDFVFVGDIVQALWTAARSDHVAGGVFNVGTGRQASVGELAALIGAALQVKVEPIFLPPRAGEVRHSRADVTLFAERTGYHATTTLAEGLNATVAAML
ncbi:GDP-mannose 4,6-dehydratase [Candidatus Chloroploca sp. M-50]|uniref:GDP-mannose 4,6-dehydratase n=1 Tax=Candidatus Chloroploca mongolica TaxID=2528176 RepID=A0ABS4D4E0_9CHLR|nr:NAD-dependent epimerase/dehydratase family protein [Candidatus Chloroploca mongolica]MBP1464306.1 GDP-mannose 4,6-dehydratase [Candidatus Chloroploca mongolica]